MIVSDVAIIGAGPYGLSAAAALRKNGVHALVFGIPMQTWKNMPEHLFLRSKITPAFNPFGDGSFGEFLKEKGKKVVADPPPIPRVLFLEYSKWFLARHALSPIEKQITELSRDDEGFFVLKTEEGEHYRARQVIVASGLNDYVHIPSDLGAMIPKKYATHTAWCGGLASFSGKRVLLVGGRQAGLEWSALLAEAGAQVDTVYRHETPDFRTPDWEILKKIVAGTLEDPAWFKHLEESEREEIVAYVRPAAKQQVEPWLEKRVEHEGITLWPNTTIAKLSEKEGKVHAAVSSRQGKGTMLGPFAHVVWATGYRPDIARVPFLSGKLREVLRTEAGYPVLDEHFSSSVPRLYFTGLIAEKAFGPLMGFMNMCDASARTLARAVQRGI